MQFNLYIFNQLLRSTLSLTFVLISIIWLFQTIRLLELIVNQGADAGQFLTMSVASIPLWLMIALPISGFIATNWVFNRILADRELVVMQSIGLSPIQLAKAPIALGILLTGFLAINSVYTLPKSFTVYKDLQFKLRNALPNILLRDGIFIEVVDGMTMFIGRRDNDNVMKDIFIHDARLRERIITINAEKGQFTEIDGNPTLILQNGERSERSPGGQRGAILFETHSVTITRDDDQPTERGYVDINEDTIINLLDKNMASSTKYFLQRHAEVTIVLHPRCLGSHYAYYRRLSFFMASFEEKWSRRVFCNISGCVLVIVCIVVARGMTTNNAGLWPLIHLSVLAPIAFSLWLIRPVWQKGEGALR